MRHARDRFGTFGLLPLAIRRVRYRFTRIRSRRSTAHADGGPAFDEKFGVETCRWAPLSELPLDSNSRQLCNDYQPVKPSALATTLRRLALDTSRYTFIDYGCGKGRALLLAAEHGFDRIVGVEFSAELCDVARQNITQYRNASRSSAAITVECADVRMFDLPPGDCVLYFYNPFQTEIFERVLDKVKSAIEAQEREILIIYHNPQCRKVLDNADFLRKIGGDVWSEDWYLIYRCKSSQESLRVNTNGARRTHQNA